MLKGVWSNFLMTKDFFGAIVLIERLFWRQRQLSPSLLCKSSPVNFRENRRGAVGVSPQAFELIPMLVGQLWKAELRLLLLPPLADISLSVADSLPEPHCESLSFAH